jgi:putative transposase
MIYVFIARRCDDLPVTACCRVMRVSTSGFYAWQTHPVSDRDYDDAVLTDHIFDIHQLSRRAYGSPRVHAELRLGDLGLRCSRKRVERLMRQANIAGIHRTRRHGCTVRDRMAVPSDDLVNRQFSVEAPDKLWVMDVTEHPTGTGKVYLATVIDAWSRRVVGWSIADHIRSELVVDALQMAVWRRRPTGPVIAHSDHGSQGGFKWPSQHLDDGGSARCLGRIVRNRSGCIGGRSRRLAGRRWRGGRTGCASGRRFPAV